MYVRSDKNTSIKTIDIIGSLNEDILNQVINIMPKLNNCSGFASIHKHCMDNTNILTLIDKDVNDGLNETINNEEEIKDLNGDDATKVCTKYSKYDLICIDTPFSLFLEEFS